MTEQTAVTGAPESTGQSGLTNVTHADIERQVLGTSENTEPDTSKQESNDSDSENDTESESESKSEFGNKGKTPKGVQKRINELVAEREAARRQAEEYSQSIREMTALLKQQQEMYAKQGQQERPAHTRINQPVADGAPDPADYPGGQWDADYHNDLFDWKLDQRDKQRQQMEYQRAAEESANARQKTFSDKESEYLKTNADYADIRSALLSDDIIADSESIGNAVLESDDPGALIHALGKNLEYAREIARMTPYKAAMALGRLEASIQKQEKPATNSKSNAPKPISPESSGASASIPSNLNEISDYEAYKTARAAQLKAKGRR